METLRMYYRLNRIISPHCADLTADKALFPEDDLLVIRDKIVPDERVIGRAQPNPEIDDD